MSSLIRVKDKFQITLPAALRSRAKIRIGDMVSASFEDNGDIRLRAQSVVDRSVAEGLADVEAGRVSEPFDTVDEMLNSMKSARRKRRA